MTNPRPRTAHLGLASLLLAAVSALGLTAACSNESASHAGGAAPVVRRDSDPRLTEARRALARGQVDVARTLLDQIGPDTGLEPKLLEVRVLLHEGDAVGALREVEAARARYAGEGRVHATAAELYAALGRIQAARDELDLGLALSGELPDLQRARGVCLITQPGGIQAGLNQLVAAHERDPSLPYLERPLSQAYLLAGRQALAESDLVTAVKHARASLEWLPDEAEARELLADAWSLGGQFEAALEQYEGLLAEGRDVRTPLAQLLNRAAIAALIASDREAALAHWQRARELGLPPEQMKSGVNMLTEEAGRRIDRGVERFTAGELAEAELDFLEALRLDPNSLVARNHLGVVLFREGDPRGAALAWTDVLELARERSFELPEPVHLNLARAYRLCGEPESVRAVLETYLAEAPDGTWAVPTRDMLAKLEAELAGR